MRFGFSPPTKTRQVQAEAAETGHTAFATTRVNISSSATSTFNFTDRSLEVPSDIARRVHNRTLLLSGSPDATPSGKRSRRSCHAIGDFADSGLPQAAVAPMATAIFRKDRLVVVIGFLLLDGRLPQSCSKYFTGAGFLYECNQANVLRIGARLEFQRNAFVKGLALLQFSYFCNLHNYRNVRQVTATVFSMQDLRFHAIQSHSHIDIGIVFGGIAVCFNARSQSRGRAVVDAHVTDAHRKLGRCDRFLKNLVHLLWIVGAHLAESVDDELRRVRGLKSESTNIVLLSFGECRGRVWVFPAIVVPIIHVFTEDDQLHAGHGLRRVQLFQQGIRGRTTGTTFGGE